MRANRPYIEASFSSLCGTFYIEIGETGLVFVANGIRILTPLWQDVPLTRRKPLLSVSSAAR